MTTATLSQSSAKVKFRLAGGGQPLILLPVEVNGEGPFEFILNAGGNPAAFARAGTEAGNHGDLGYNYLRNYKVALDYPNGKLSLFTP